jgi:hypothetical protein
VCALRQKEAGDLTPGASGCLVPPGIPGRDRAPRIGTRGGHPHGQPRPAAPGDAADPEDGERVAKGMQACLGTVARPAARSPEEHGTVGAPRAEEGRPWSGNP